MAQWKKIPREGGDVTFNTVIVYGDFSGSATGAFGITSSNIVGDFSRIATGSVIATVSVNDNAFVLERSGSSLINVSSSGNVGINTAPTGYKLDVLGTQRVQGKLTVSQTGADITGSLAVSGSSTLSGSLQSSGSNTFIGLNNLAGVSSLTGITTLSGSVYLSGSRNTNPTIKINGDIEHTGITKMIPISASIDSSISASYVYVDQSTNDLYFEQNGNGYANRTRLRWLEGNMYTGLLHGGLLSVTPGATTYNMSSGSGIVVTLNASIADDPYPTVRYVKWDNYVSQSLTFLTASIQTFVGIDPTGSIIQSNTPWTDGQYNTSISIGTVLHQNKATVNSAISYPNVAYGYKQRTYDFIKAFGPLKLSGFTLYPSSSLGLTVGGGTAFSDGRNYQNDPNNPSYITDLGTTVSKIFRYYQSGSEFVLDTSGSLGYTVIDPVNYNNNGTLTPVPGTGANRQWSIQRVFWYPNSATKGIVVYYGNATYETRTDAIANIEFETFNEVANTQQNAIYLAAVVIRNDGIFTDAETYSIRPGGIFRSVGGSGGGGSAATTRLIDLTDTAILTPTSGQALVYNSTLLKWVNSSYMSASISGNADTATSSSYALTASYAANAVSSSYSSNSWTLTGNSGTNPSTNYVGTSDSSSLSIRTNGVERMSISSSGRIMMFPNGRQPLSLFHMNDSTGGVFTTVNYNGTASAGYGYIRSGYYDGNTNTWNISTGYVGGSNQTTSGLRLVGTDDAGGQHSITLGLSSDLGTNRSVTFKGSNTFSGGNTTEFRFVGSITNQLGATGTGLGLYQTFGSSITDGKHEALRISPYISNTGATLLINMGTNSAAENTGTHTARFTVDSLGNTSIGSGTIDSSSILTMNSTSSGFLIPRLTSTQKNAISSPATGLMVYDTTDSRFYAYSSSWRGLAYMNDISSSGLIYTGDTTRNYLSYGAGSGSMLGTASNGRNIAIGESSMASITSGIANIGLGYATLRDVTVGSYNTSIGYQALIANGNYTTAIGYNAGTLGGQNSVMVGAGAGYYGGTENTAVGQAALGASQNSGYNTAVGYGSLYYMQTGGSYNTAIGHSAGYTSQTGSYNVVIGAGTRLPSITGSNQLQIGSSTVNWISKFTGNNFLINAGGATISTATPSAALEIYSVSGGLLIPRLTTTQKNAISSPATGLILYDTTDSRFYAYSGSWRGVAYVDDIAASSSIATSGTTLYSTKPGTANFSTSNGIFFGESAGTSATNANNSNFFGNNAGQFATNAAYSNFFGLNSGFLAGSAAYSNFFGARAGQYAGGATYSNLLGPYSGYNATSASYSNLFGYNVGYTSNTTASIGTNNIIIGTNISLPAATTNSINLGGVLFGVNTYSTSSGNPSITAQESGRIGIRTVVPDASSALEIGGTTGGLLMPRLTTIQKNAISSPATGLMVFDSTDSRFYAYSSSWKGLAYVSELGASSSIATFGTALYSTNPSTSNFGPGGIFLGPNAGRDASSANNSIFLGYEAGYNGVDAGESIFLGYRAGRDAESANESNFIGYEAGIGATTAYDSNFIGLQAGYSASSANSSNFLGYQAGYSASNASFSNLIGYKAGTTFAGNSIGPNNIVIGTNISLPNSASDSINIGGVLFGVNTYSTASGSPSIAAQANGRIGIRTVTPHSSSALEIGGTTGGILIPRLTTTQKNAISGPATGLMVFDSTDSRFYAYSGSAWRGLAYSDENSSMISASSVTASTFTGNTFISSGSYGTATMNAGNNPSMMVFSGSNTIGGSGYIDFIKVTNNSSGSTNPNKTLRLNNAGGFEIVNSAYNGVALTLSDSGNLSIGGYLNPTTWTAGQVIKDIMLSNTEVTVSATTVGTSTSDTDFVTYSYTPVSSNSYLMIHYHLSDYTFESGTGNDSYFSRIKVDGNEITYSNQSTVNGSRSGVLFPLTGRYTNSNTTAKSIVIACRRDSADDSITIANTATSMWLRITEVAR